MQADRDMLVKKIFPQLRKLCESRAVIWTDVDLRWGITSEQQAEGKVLPYCLAEIERSRPFFIGLLGERYGWVPRSVPAELLEQQPWLREHLEHSVTELEILHGVLNNPAMAERALFYFRDPAYVVATPPLKTANLIETDADASRNQQKLTDLKNRIRTAAGQKKIKYQPRENYANPEVLGDLIQADFIKIIDEIYPPNEVPDPLDQEANRHEEHARSRRDLYIARPALFDFLDQHVGSAEPPLVLTGESGCGKTALLANWVERYRLSHPEDLIVQHYIGSTPDSADWMSVVTRILGELKRGFNMSEDLPSTPEMLRSALNEWFVNIADGRRIALVLDGLNQLEDRDNAQELVWLPRVLPANVRVLTSSLPGKAFDATQKRGWPTTKVALLSGDERKQITSGYLGLAGRTASKELLSAIEAQPQTFSPLYLRTFLDEIRVFGRFEELPETVEGYLSAATPSELYGLIIQRWVRDYPEARVADVLRMIWAARRGLSEAELMDLLGQDGQPFPRQSWTPFYLVAERSLAMRAGLLNFGHDYLRAAVQKEVFSDDPSPSAVRLRLAEYFQKTDEPTDRKAEELPWLLREARAWEQLKDCLTNLPLFEKLREDRWKWELHGYWMSLQGRFDPVQCYEAALERLSRTGVEDQVIAGIFDKVAVFHLDAGRYGPAEPLFRRALQARERALGFEHSDTLISLNNLAGLLYRQGDYAAAEPLARRGLEVRERVLGPEHPHTLLSVNNLGQLLTMQGHYAAAEPLYRRALEARERVLGLEDPDTLTTMTSLANLLESKGDYDAAEHLDRRTLEARERVLGPEHPETLASVTSVADLLERKGDYDAAEHLYRRALEARERVLGPEHPSALNSLNYLARLLHQKGDHAGAEPLYRRALEARERVLGPESPDTLVSVNNLGNLLRDKGDYASAAALYQRASGAFERVLGPGHPVTLVSVNNLAALLDDKGDYAAAEPLYMRVLDTRERVLGPEHPDTLTSVNNLAVLLDNKGDYTGAESLHRRAFGAFERVLGPEHPSTLTSADNLGAVLDRKGDYAGAEPLYRRVLEARVRMFGPDHPGTLTSMNRIAGLLESRGDYAAAAALYSQALQANERSGRDSQATFALDLNNYALLLHKLGQYDDAANLLRRAIAIEDRSLSQNHPNRAYRRNNLAIACLVGGQIEQAMLANGEAWQFKAGEHDLTSTRILFTRISICLLCDANAKLYLGQLKTLLIVSGLPRLSGVTRKWDARSILEPIRSKLPAGVGEFWSELFDVLIDPTKLTNLDRFEQWRAAIAEPLDAPWPGVHPTPL